jgi:hypothetical protein
MLTGGSSARIGKGMFDRCSDVGVSERYLTLWWKVWVGCGSVPIIGSASQGIWLSHHKSLPGSAAEDFGEEGLGGVGGGDSVSARYGSLGKVRIDVGARR